MKECSPHVITVCVKGESVSFDSIQEAHQFIVRMAEQGVIGLTLDVSSGYAAIKSEGGDMSDEELIEMLRVGYLRGVSDGKLGVTPREDDEEPASFNVARAIVIAHRRVQAAKRDFHALIDGKRGES